VRPALGFVLILAILPVLAGESKDPAANAHEGAAWLASRLTEIRAASASDSADLTRRSLDGVRERLVEGGMEEDLARVLTAGPHGVGEDQARQRSPRALEIARRRLEAFAKAASRADPAVPEGARPRLLRILEDPVFKTMAAGASLFERLIDGLNRFFLHLLERVVDFLGSYPRFVDWIVLAMIVGALVAAAARLAASTLRRDRPGARTPPLAAEAETAALDAEDVLDRARAYAASGGLSRALRLLEMAAVMALRARGDLPRQPGLTDLEGVRLLRERAAPELRSAFERLTALHDRLVYGGRRVETEAVNEAAILAEDIVHRPAGG